MVEDLCNLLANIVDLLVAECHDINCLGGGGWDSTDLWLELVRIGDEWEIPKDMKKHIHSCWDCWRQATGTGDDLDIGYYTWYNLPEEEKNKIKPRPNMFEIDFRAEKKGWINPRQSDPNSKHNERLKMGKAKTTVEWKL